MKNISVTPRSYERYSLRAFSLLLALLLIVQTFALIPKSNAVDAIQIDTSAELIAAGLDPAVVNIKITGDVVLTANLVINHSMNITRGDLVTGSPVISGFGVEINSAAVVNMDHISLTGQNTQPEGKYGVMIQGGAKLVADNLTMNLSATLEDNVGFNVDSASVLTLSNSTVSWASGAGNKQQYAVYAQSGAGAITLRSSTFAFGALNVPGAYSYLVGMQGDLVSNYPALTLESNVSNAYMKFLMYGADVQANKEAWISNFVTTTAGDNRIGMTGGSDGVSGIYTKLVGAWGKNITAGIESDLRAAVLVENAIITLSDSITLTTTNLTMGKSITLIGNSKVLSGTGLEITSASTVVIDHLSITGLNVQAGDGNYGVMVQGASHLTASYLNISLNQTGANNVGFNVASGSTLSLSNSTLTWGASVVALQQYGVYAQAGAGSITLNSNTFTFSANNVPSAYSYLIGMQGDLVADYPSLTLTSNVNNSFMKLLIYGAVSVASKQAKADLSMSATVGDNKAGLVTISGGSIYTKYLESWGVVNEVELQAAANVANAVVNLGQAITLSANLNLANGVAIHTNGFALNLGVFQVISAPATVTTIVRDVVTVINGTTQISQVSLVAIPTKSLIQLGETTSMITSGGSGDGLVSYITTSPDVCSVTATGVVTALTAGSCLVTATKAVSGNYFVAVSAVVAITVSDSDAIAARLAALRAFVEAERVRIAAEVEAERARIAALAVEGGGGAPIANADLNTIRYAIGTRTKTIFLDLADKYTGEIAIVDAKMMVLEDGKYVLRYVPIASVTLVNFGRAKIKTLVDLKIGAIIRVRTDSGLLKYVTVK